MTLSAIPASLRWSATRARPEARATGIADDVLELVGGTPLLRLAGLPGIGAPVLAKLEGLNPGGSMKDRTAAAILSSALREGRIAPGGRVVESTSGNFGVGLAQAAAVLGLRLTCVIDPRCSQASSRAMRALGAEVVEVTEPDPVSGDFLVARLAVVHRMLAEDPSALWPNQYGNDENPRAHAAGTMREIDDALGDELAHLYVATSTTGTLVGCSDLLRERGRAARVVAVDAVGSVLFGGRRGRRLLPGYGAGCVPELARQARPDAVVRIDELEAIRWCRRIARTNGVLIGASGGAVVAAAARDRAEGRSGAAVVILADRGTAYLDTVYDDAWIAERFGEPALDALHADAA